MPGVLGGVGAWQRRACCSLKAVGRSSQRSNRWIGGMWLAAGLGSQFNASLPVRTRVNVVACPCAAEERRVAGLHTKFHASHPACCRGAARGHLRYGRRAGALARGWRQVRATGEMRLRAAVHWAVRCYFTALCASGSGWSTSVTGLGLQLGWVVLQRSARVNRGLAVSLSSLGPPLAAGRRCSCYRQQGSVVQNPFLTPSRPVPCLHRNAKTNSCLSPLHPLQVLPLLLQGCADRDVNVRQCSVYGLGCAAQHR